MKLSPLQALRAAADFASRTAARKNIHQVLFMCAASGSAETKLNLIGSP